MNHSDENDDYAEIAARWVEGTISHQQRHKFNAWYHQDQDQPLIIPASFADDAETHKARIYQKVLTVMEDRSASVPAKKLWKRVGIAVSICMLFSVALYFYLQRSVVYDLDQLARQYGHGSNVAVLTSENGKQFLLEDSVFNMLSKGGKFNSDLGDGLTSITTPRGAHYQVLLGDGTKIWLGAASSITYPATFSGPTRTVRLSGEAYFEVAHQQKPFHVEVISHEHQLDIAVVGTKFNVNAYPEDPEIRTRVFEGSVKLSSGKYTAILTKGEKAVFRNGILQPKVKNLEEDWMRSGTLHFDNEDIEQVIRMLAREYNVKLVYNGRVGKKMYLTGEISRKNTLEKVLNLIELATDYHFLLEDERVTVFEPGKIRN